MKERFIGEERWALKSKYPSTQLSINLSICLYLSIYLCRYTILFLISIQKIGRDKETEKRIVQDLPKTADVVVLRGRIITLY